MTVREAFNQGYQEYDRSWQRGYISCKTDVMKQPVLTAGGNRKGELYYLEPSTLSNQFCQRVYIRKNDLRSRLEREGIYLG